MRSNFFILQYVYIQKKSAEHLWIRRIDLGTVKCYYSKQHSMQTHTTIPLAGKEMYFLYNHRKKAGWLPIVVLLWTSRKKRWFLTLEYMTRYLILEDKIREALYYLHNWYMHINRPNFASVVYSKAKEI